MIGVRAACRDLTRCVELGESNLGEFLAKLVHVWHYLTALPAVGGNDWIGWRVEEIEARVSRSKTLVVWRMLNRMFNICTMAAGEKAPQRFLLSVSAEAVSENREPCHRSSK